MKKAFISITALLVLLILLLLGTYFLSFILTESRISKSQVVASQAYYLAEAGIGEAIWKLKNDQTWRDNFITEGTCENWNDSFVRSTDSLFPGSSYEVSIQNSACAMGQIISTAQIDLSEGRTAQRVIKTDIFKAIGSLTYDSGVFVGGPGESVDIFLSTVNINDGNLFANKHLNINLSTVTITDDLSTTEVLEGKALAGDNLNNSGSTLNVEARCADNVCDANCDESDECPPSEVSMPLIIFDDINPTDGFDSYLELARAADGSCSHTCDGGQCMCSGSPCDCGGIPCTQKCEFTKSQFKDLLDAASGGTLTLNNNINGVIFVDGQIDLEKGRELIINGALVGMSHIYIGQGGSCCLEGITVNDPGVGIPSGILANGKLYFGVNSSLTDINITGLLYSGNQMKIMSVPKQFNLTGGLLSRKISIQFSLFGFTVNFDEDIVREGLWADQGSPPGEVIPFSPVVVIDHWEEEY